MLLQMFGFLFVLIVVGGLATLVAVGDPHHGRLTPCIGFVSLFAGLGALLLSVVLAWLGSILFGSEEVMGLGLLGGYALGGLVGAILGVYRAVNHWKRIEFDAHE